MAHILIVDDEADGRDALAATLGKYGHDVECQPNGRQALASLVSRIPDMVILDLRMPEMDGVMLLEVMRSYLRWHALPVILLTAYPEDPRLAKTDELDVTSVMCKGNYKMADLLALIDELTGTPSA